MGHIVSSDWPDELWESGNLVRAWMMRAGGEHPSAEGSRKNSVVSNYALHRINVSTPEIEYTRPVFCKKDRRMRILPGSKTIRQIRRAALSISGTEALSRSSRGEIRAKYAITTMYSDWICRRYQGGVFLWRSCRQSRSHVRPRRSAGRGHNYGYTPPRCDAGDKSIITYKTAGNRLTVARSNT